MTHLILNNIIKDKRQEMHTHPTQTHTQDHMKLKHTCVTNTNTHCRGFYGIVLFEWMDRWIIEESEAEGEELLCLSDGSPLTSDP